MDRKCGECQACCYAVRVEQLKKPPARRCEHQCSSGCAVYELPSKPQACSTYTCGWLNGLGRTEDRPDKSGLILEGFQAVKQRDGGFNQWTYLIFDLEGQPVSLSEHTAFLTSFVRKGVSAWSYPKDAGGEISVELACHDKHDEHYTGLMVAYMLDGGEIHMADGFVKFPGVKYD